jgi:Ser/Thr protein kinase RdoA (MazF antagonist)
VWYQGGIKPNSTQKAGKIEDEWHFVVMEEIKCMCPLKEVEDKLILIEQLRQLLILLEKMQYRYVHGDLRINNVGWDPQKQHIMVLDFDWAGKYPHVKY